jgi:hypothetical protein
VNGVNTSTTDKTCRLLADIFHLLISRYYHRGPPVDPSSA